MPHVFASLAVANLALFALSAAFALSSAASARDRHILLAVFSLLLSCFIQVLVFTYLTITGKVIAQAVHLARLDPRHPLPSQGSQTIFHPLPGHHRNGGRPPLRDRRRGLALRACTGPPRAGGDFGRPYSCPALQKATHLGPPQHPVAYGDVARLFHVARGTTWIRRYPLRAV